MRRVSLCILIAAGSFVWGVFGHAYAQPPSHSMPDVRPMVFSMEECIAMALAQNEKLQAAGYGVAAAQGQLTEARARGMPVFEYEAQVAPVPVDVNIALESFFRGNITIWTKLRMVLGVPLYAFGALTEVREMAERGVTAARHKVVKERNELIRDVKKIYYGILFGKEMERLLTKAIDGLTDKIESEESAEEPSLSPFEILEMKVFREEIITGLERTRTELDLAYEGLKLQMGLPRNARIKLDRDKLDPEVVDLSPMGEYVDASMEFNPQSKLIEVGVDVKRKQMRLEKLKLAPQIGVGFFLEAARAAGDIKGITTTDDFNNPFNYTRAGIGLQVKGKIDFHGAYGRIKKARAEYLKALYEGRMGKKGLRLDARKAYDEVVKYQKKVFSMKRSVSLSNQMTFLSKTNFEMGIGDIDNYRRALELSLATQGQYLQAIFDYNTSLVNLEQKVGRRAYAQLTGRPDIPVYEAFDVSADLDEFTGEGDDDEFIFEDDEEAADAPGDVD